MRYGIFADIHSNLEAFTVVLKEYRGEKIDQYLCVGDIVGYGANPNECVDLVRKLECKTVAGNHDYAAIGLTDITYFNPYAREAVLWTRDELTRSNKEFLKNLPLKEEFEEFLLVHSTPYNPAEWNYIFTLTDAEVSFHYFKQQSCFVAHSHQPFIVVKDKKGGCQSLEARVVKIEEGFRYLINVGSVGQPRDGNPQACYVIYDPEKKEVEIKRVIYNIQRAQEKIIKAGLPPELAWRLAYGE